MKNALLFLLTVILVGCGRTKLTRAQQDSLLVRQIMAKGWARDSIFFDSRVTAEDTSAGVAFLVIDETRCISLQLGDTFPPYSTQPIV